MSVTTRKPLCWFKPDPNQPRKDFNEGELRQLGESLKKKQIQPIFCQPDGAIITGERRYRAALLVGMSDLEVKIADTILLTGDVAIWQLVENMQRSDLTGHEQYVGCADLISSQSWQMKDLAEHLSLTAATVTRILSPSKLTEEWRNALKDGKVTISDCYAASKLPHHQQGGLLALKLSGANREALEEAGRKARAPQTQIVRQARVVCPLMSGAKVTVTGEEMDLDQVIEALQGALEAARKANKDSLDVKTAERVWRDRCRVSRG